MPVMIVIQMAKVMTKKYIIIAILVFLSLSYSQDDITGRVSLSSFANFTDGLSNPNSLRLKPRLSFKSENISNTKFSLTGFINADYRQYKRSEENLSSKYLRIYDLAVLYKYNDNTSITFGRKINPKISSIGVIDGFQLDKSWKNFATGVVIGSRPDMTDFGFNHKLFETGLYIGYKKNNHQSSVALIQQMNGKSVDRRSLYFTHFNRFSDKLRYYINSDIDLYKKINGEASSIFRLTGLYFSLTYRPIRKISFTSSYNSRKNIIYYETFKTYAEQLYDDETRKGLKFRMNWKPWRYIYIGTNMGYRFKNSDDRSSFNYSYYVGHSNLPKLKMSVRITASQITSNYLDGNIFDLYLSKQLFKNRINLSSNFKYIEYDYINSGISLIQRQFTSDITWQLKNKMSITVTYIGSFEQLIDYTQIYMMITQKF